MNKRLRIVLYISFFIVGCIGCKSTPEPKEDPQPKVQPQAEIQSQPIEDVETEAQKKEKEQFLSEIKKLRQQAISLHADTVYPDLFKIADETAEASRSAYDSKEFAVAKEKAQQALLQYRVLINKMHIDAVKEKINKHHFADHDAENYQKGEDLLSKIENAYTSDSQKSYELSMEALKAYEAVTNIGFKLLAEEARRKADEAKKVCDSIKAARSAKDLYEKAKLSYRQADAAITNENFEQAYTQYTASADAFTHGYEMANTKRMAAAEAMEKARQRQEASTKLAQDADSEVPLPEKIEGFSDEPIDIEALKKLDEAIEGSPSETHSLDSTLSIDNNSNDIQHSKEETATLDSANNKQSTMHEEASTPEKGDSQ